LDFLDLELEEEEEEREEREEREELLREAEDFRMVGADRGRDVWGEDGLSLCSCGCEQSLRQNVKGPL